MITEMWDVSRPIAYARNPRRNEAAIDKVASSLKEFGFRQPIVVDREGVIIVGHTRLLAAKKLGLKEVPVHMADMTPAAARAYRIADNKTNEFATWDDELLALEFEDLKLDGFDLGLTGFDDEELNGLLAQGTKEGLTDDDEVPEVPEEPVSKLGDLWILGKHRLLCGDSTKREDVARLMDGAKADLVVTDPPYNVSYTGKTKDALTIQNDSMSDGGFYKFLLAVYTNLLDAMNDGAAIYVFHADMEGVNFRKALVDAGLKLSQCCVWVKQTLVMGRQDYHWQHEPVLYGWKPTGSHSWHSDRKQTTVWNFDRPTRSTDHPTMKPVDLIKYPITNSSKANQTVLDLFGGSGSTLIACEKTNRQARLMELDPKYCDVIVKRFQDFTGESATLDGRTFDEVAMERTGKAAAA